MATPWDDTIKKLIFTNPAAFVRLILPQARFIESLSPLLKQETLEMDGLFLIELDGQLFLLHIEFQTYYDAQMAERLLRYNILARMQYKVPAVSCVIHLLDDTPMKPSPARWPVAGKQEEQVFPYHVVELSQWTSEDLIQLGEVTLLPLLPFTKGGRSRETITQMFRLIEQNAMVSEADKHILELIGFTFASLILERKQSSELDWLIRRFQSMYDILQDTPIFREIRRIAHEEGHEKGRQEGWQEGLQEGRQEGLQEGRQEGQLETARRWLLRMTQTRFRPLTPLVQQQAELITNPDVLEELMVQINTAQNLEEAWHAFSQWVEKQNTQ